MTEDTHKEMPAVGKPSGSSKTVGGILIMALLAVVVYGILKSRKEDDVQQPEAIDYNPAGYTNERVFVREQPKEKPKRKVVQETMTKSPGRDELLALLAEQKRKEEQLAAKIEEKKRRSQTNIFKKKASINKSVNNTQAAFPVSFQDQETQKPEGVLNLGNPQSVDTEYAVKINNTSLMIGAGKFIRGVLETSIDSTLPGQVRAVVANDVYSENGSRVLIDKGSRLVGQYQSGIRQGQNRVFVIWSHVTTPSGIQISLESSGTDALGTTGLTGDYDSHFFKRFGGALLLSVIEGYSNDNDNELNINGGNSLNRASAVALENSINIPPTIYVDQGSSINVFIARNLNFEGVL